MDENRKDRIKTDYFSEIRRTVKEKNAVLLAHYYQESDIQELADFVGDSLALANYAASTDSNLIVFAGVHFMAETVKIINPHKKVIVPDLEASCSLAESCSPEKFKKFKEEHPKHVVVSYINTTAEIKAMSDIICTSSNAKNIINSIPEEKEIIFGPDYNMGKYLNDLTGRNMVLWDGYCVVHESFALDKIMRLFKKNPGSKIIAHPESSEEILKVASFIGSTSALINYAVNDAAKTYIVATEAGILHEMQSQIPGKKLIPAPVYEDNACACGECAFMKLNTIEKLYNCIINEEPEVTLPEKLRLKAKKPIERMLEVRP